MTGWVRSGRCAGNGDCVEALRYFQGKHIGLRLSRKPEYELHVTRAEWDAFIAGVKDGDFDNLGDT